MFENNCKLAQDYTSPMYNTYAAEGLIPRQNWKHFCLVRIISDFFIMFSKVVRKLIYIYSNFSDVESVNLILSLSDILMLCCI